ncbi:hypothetical protein [Shewanella sp. ANA-3]|uniref:hypothetical protein n=1 Tax=Shewanella sp. (strain ANA-3) TaxID=94122 RepID=UPI00059EBE08|nr:hypothetical protein [Shewanella sp. ANA-3]
MDLRKYAEQQKAFSNELVAAEEAVSQLEKEKAQYVEKLTKFKSEVQDIVNLSAAQCVKRLARASVIETLRLKLPLSKASGLKITNETELVHQQEFNRALEANIEVAGAFDECTNLLEQYDQAIQDEKTVFLEKKAAQKRKLTKVIKILLILLVIAGIVGIKLIMNKNPGVQG